MPFVALTNYVLILVRPPCSRMLQRYSNYALAFKVAGDKYCLALGISSCFINEPQRRYEMQVSSRFWTQ